MLPTIAAALAGALALSAELESQFVRIDANGDGFIARHEAWADSRVERRFELADRNQDGLLDRAEYQQLTMGFTAAQAPGPGARPPKPPTNRPR